MKTKEEIIRSYDCVIKDFGEGPEELYDVYNIESVLSAMTEFGEKMYNQAIDDAVREAEVDYFMEEDICCHSVDIKSILKLKKL